MSLSAFGTASFLPRYTPAQLAAHERIKALRAKMAVRPVAPAPVEVAEPTPPPRDPVPMFRVAYDNTRERRVRTGADKAKRLLSLVCKMHGVLPSDVMSARRSRPAVEARHHYIWLLYRFTTWSMPQIGRHIGRDHTTVIHALQRLTKLRPDRPSYGEIRPSNAQPPRPFTMEDDAKLLELRAKGFTFSTAAIHMGRAPGALWGRYRVLKGHPARQGRDA